MDAKTILMGIGLLAVVIVALKFGKQILTLAIILAVVVAIAWIAWLVLQSGAVNSETLGDAADVARLLRPEPEPEPVATTPVWVYLCAGAGGTLVLAALVVAGVFWLRLRLGSVGGGYRSLPKRETRRSYDDRWPILVIDGEADLGWDEWGG
jgi:alpha-beta hydrolase superfamily lysophospholipase